VEITDAMVEAAFEVMLDADLGELNPSRELARKVLTSALSSCPGPRVPAVERRPSEDDGAPLEPIY
jgi:hypothetical protein